MLIQVVVVQVVHGGTSRGSSGSDNCDGGCGGISKGRYAGTETKWY